MILKDIITEMDGMEVPLIFSQRLDHELVAAAVKTKLRSAGFLRIESCRPVAGLWAIGFIGSGRAQDAAILDAQTRSQASFCV
jgi:hypothetical protein